jgi:hypothetical protein
MNPTGSTGKQEQEEAAMAIEQIGNYEVEYSGVQLADADGWAAWVEIFGPSHNPMHRASVFPSQRVAVETSFHTREEAEREARQIAVGMIEQGRHHASPG